jgi:HEAT repeat protein
MRKALADLIMRMATPEHRCTNSDDSISWKAYREAETLDDPSIVDELAEYLGHEPDRGIRRHAYFILGKLGRKVRGRDCASILLSHLSTETNKYVLSVLLDALGGVGKPAELDLIPVFRLLKDDRWLVRHSAIQALRHTDSPAVEDQLLHLLEATSDPYDMTYCHATLNEIGSARAIPFLEKNLKSRKRDVKMSAKFAIEAIKARTER